MKRPLMLICILSMVVATLIYRINQSDVPPVVLPVDKVSLQGRVASMEYRYGQTILFLSDLLCYGDSAEIFSMNNINGVMCYMEETQEIKLGQEVAVQGCLTWQKTAGNEGEFDAFSYYEAKGYECMMQDAVLIKKGQRWDVMLQALHVIRQRAKQQLYLHLDEEDAGIMTALLLGDKTGMSAEIKEVYRSAGIYHILAVSGLHISLIGGTLYKLLKRLKIPPKIAAVIGIAGIILYGIMIGMPPSAFRAIFMFALGVTAEQINRTNDRLTALALAGACLITTNPLLIEDTGVQLSFLAVLGISCLYPTFTPLQQNKMPFADGILVSFSITYFTLPVIMCAYYEVPVYSIFINAIILPFVPLLLGLGVLVILAGSGFRIVATATAWFIHAILFYYEKVTEVCNILPGGNYVTGAPPLWKIVTFYLVLGIMIFSVLRIKRKLLIHSLESENDYFEGRREKYALKQKHIRKSIKIMRMMQVLVMTVLIVFLAFHVKGEVQITFLNVGQGDGVCIEGKEAVYLIDCGSTSKTGIGTYTLLPFLKYQGISEIEGWFLTHSDSDHVSAFTELCKKDHMGGIQVHTIYIPKVLKEEFKEIISHAVEQGIEVVLLEEGDKLSDGQMRWTVLAPEKSEYYMDENQASLVLYLEYESFTGLFMGDAGTKSEQEILEADIGNITMLKVGHHGSAVDTNSEAFISCVSPEIAVISCGENNSYGHPHKEVLERLEESQSLVYRTDQVGQISIVIKGAQISVKTF